MDGVELVVTVQAVNLCVHLFLFVTVGWFTFKRVLPRLTPSAKRLATGMLSAQGVVIVVALLYQPPSDFATWFFGLEYEWNIPSAFAGTQLLMVAVVAMLSAWLSRKETYWHPLYFVSLGCFFIFMALDEFFIFYKTIMHDYLEVSHFPYIIPSIPLIGAVLVAAVRSSAPKKGWHIFLLASLALVGLGTIVFDFETWPLICDNLGFLRIEGCYGLHWIEELVELLAVWLTLVAVLGLFSNVAPQQSHRHTVNPHIAPAIIFLLLLLYSAVFSYGFDELRHLPLRLSVRHALSEMSPAAVHFEPDIHLRGFTINVDNEATAVRLYSSAGLSLTHRLGQSVHLVDQDSGKSIASQDKIWCCPSILQVDGPNCARKCKRERIYPDWLQNEPIYHQRFEIYVPPSAPTNRAYWIVLTLWRKDEGEFVRQKVLDSDHQLLDDTQVVLGELVLPGMSTRSSTTPLAEFNNGFALEAVDIPDWARAGETMRIEFAWRSDSDGEEDHVQFLHFGNVESGEWWVYDQPPLGPRLPTRLWYSGLADSEVWEVPLPPDLAPGRYEVFTGLYQSRDRERVPARDADGLAWLDGRVSVGSLIIE